MNRFKTAITHAYRRLTHKKTSYDREEAYEEGQKIYHWIKYGSVRKFANMTEEEVKSNCLKFLTYEKKLLNKLLPETHNIEEHREQLTWFVDAQRFQFGRNHSSYEEEAIKSVRKQTESELEKFHFTFCGNLKHPKLEEIDMVADSVRKRNEIEKKVYAITRRLEGQLRELEVQSKVGGVNADNELFRIKKEFDKNIKLFEETGLLDSSDKKLIEIYNIVG